MATFSRLSLICISTIFVSSFSHAQAGSAAAIAARSQIMSAFEASVATHAEPNFSILKTLDFKSQSYQETVQRLGVRFTYPQGFEIDEQRDLLYVLRYSNGRPARAVIEKYRWSSGELLSTYIIPEPQASVSEGIVVTQEEGGDVAFLRSDSALTRYRLVDDQSGFGTTQKLEAVASNVAQSFYHKGGEWYVEKFKTPEDALGQSRGQYSVLDSSFKHVRDVNFAPQYSGYRNSEQLNLPKHQGFAVTDDGYAMTMGGYWASRMKATPYHYFGVNLFDRHGKIVKSEYIAPEALVSQLLAMGIQADTVENEGIQALSNGKLVTLQVVRTKGERSGKLLFLTLSP